MNREIKFRALKDDMANCIFMYGQLVYDVIGKPRITAINRSGDGLTFHTCLKGTEGQFTGLKDKNGVEIYEGDIVKHNGDINEKDLIVTFKDGSFCIGKEGIRDDEMRSFVTIRDAKLQANILGFTLILEVIGNIHQTPTVQ